MQHALIVKVLTIKLFQTTLLFIDHFSHAFASIHLIDISSLILSLLLCLYNISARLLQLFLHTHFVSHEMSIDLRLLHEIFKTLLLQQSFFFLLLLLLHFFVKLLLLTFHVSELLVTPLPETEHFPGKFLSSHHTLFGIPLRSDSLLFHLIHTTS